MALHRKAKEVFSESLLNINKKGDSISINIINIGGKYKAYFIGYEEPQYIRSILRLLDRKDNNI